MQRQDLPARLTSADKNRQSPITREVDPDLDFVCSIIMESHLSLQEIEDRTIKLGRKVSKKTMALWLWGNTMRPHNLTLTMVALTLGYHRVWSKKSN